MKTLIIFALGFMLNEALNSQEIAVQKYQVNSGSKLELAAVGNPSMLSISGTGQGLTGTILVQKDGEMRGEIQMDLNTLDAGLDIRTSHMKKKYLEIEKNDFSRARFKITKANFNQNPVVFDGTMYLHGIEKPLSGTGVLTKNSGGFFLLSEFSINIQDYGITIPNYAGITLEKMVTLKLNLSSSLVE